MDTRWKRATRSEGANNCVELAHVGAVRDSKNPGGPALQVGLAAMVAAVKTGRLDR
jgi:hypothetical protein